MEVTVLTTSASDWGFAVSLCPKAPAGGCMQATSGLLHIKKAPVDTKDLVVWKWQHGPITTKGDFGSPLTTTDYALCVYDAASSVLGVKLRPVAAHGGLCAGKPCWKEGGTGFRYQNKALTPNGTLKMVLHEGLVAGKSKITIAGKGAGLGVPTLPLAQDPTVKVELRSNTGQCWEAMYSTHLKNDTGQFKAKAD